MARAFDLFEDYFDIVDNTVWPEPPDFVDLAFQFQVPKELELGWLYSMTRHLQERIYVFANLAIPELYNACRDGHGDLFERQANYANFYFESFVLALNLGSIDIKIRIKIGTKGKQEGQRNPKRFLRSLMVAFVSTIDIVSGALTIADHLSHKPPPPAAAVTIKRDLSLPPMHTISARVVGERGSELEHIHTQTLPPMA